MPRRRHRRSPTAVPNCAPPPAGAPSGHAGCARSHPRPAAPPAARPDENSAEPRPRARAYGAIPPPPAAALAQKRFYASVLERVKRNHRETAARHQQPLGGGQSAIQFAQFVVDRNAQRLKRAGSRIEPGLTCRDRGAHDLGQLAGAANRRMLARRDDRPRDAAGEALLAERADHPGQLVLGKPGDEVGRALPLRAHAHVERSVEPERKAALRGIELQRRDAEIEGDTGHRTGRSPPRRAAPCRRIGPRSVEVAPDTRRRAPRRAAARRDRDRSRRHGIAPPRAAPRCIRRRRKCRPHRLRRLAARAPRQLRRPAPGHGPRQSGQKRFPECPIRDVGAVRLPPIPPAPTSRRARVTRRLRPHDGPRRNAAAMSCPAGASVRGPRRGVPRIAPGPTAGTSRPSPTKATSQPIPACSLSVSGKTMRPSGSIDIGCESAKICVRFSYSSENCSRVSIRRCISSMRLLPVHSTAGTRREGNATTRFGWVLVARVERKVAGTETRPLRSTLFT